MSDSNNSSTNPVSEGDFSLCPFALDSGATLPAATLRYAVYGTLNARRDNAILVCHALSGSARVADWWPEIVGPGCALDTTRWCVVGVNVLGSCYGSTGPTSVNPLTGCIYGADFPLVTIGDMVRAQAQLLDTLGITRLRAVVGGSLGGMQALEWAARFPERVARCLALGATPLPALGLAFNHLQREAVRLGGLSLARQMAMCTYKSAALFDQRHARRSDRHDTARFDIAGYLAHQGETFVKRFDAHTYVTLTHAMDNFSLAREGRTTAEVLRCVTARVLLAGISSDWLFPTDEVERLAQQFRAAGVSVRYENIVSQHGHDAFLAEAEKFAPLVAEFMEAQNGRAQRKPGRNGRAQRKPGRTDCQPVRVGQRLAAMSPKAAKSGRVR